jgi:hypothetical protein
MGSKETRCELRSVGTRGKTKHPRRWEPPEDGGFTLFAERKSVAEDHQVRGERELLEVIERLGKFSPTSHDVDIRRDTAACTCECAPSDRMCLSDENSGVSATRRGGSSILGHVRHSVFLLCS